MEVENLTDLENLLSLYKEFKYVSIAISTFSKNLKIIYLRRGDEY